MPNKHGRYNGHHHGHRRHGDRRVITPQFDAEEPVNNPHEEGHGSLAESEVSDDRRLCKDHQYYRQEAELTSTEYFMGAADSLHQRRHRQTGGGTRVLYQGNEWIWDEDNSQWFTEVTYPGSPSSIGRIYYPQDDEQYDSGSHANTATEGDENDILNYEKHYEQDSGYCEGFDGENENSSEFDIYGNLVSATNTQHVGHGSSVKEHKDRDDDDGSYAKVRLLSHDKAPQWMPVTHIMDTGNRTGFHMVSQGILGRLGYRDEYCHQGFDDPRPFRTGKYTEWTLGSIELDLKVQEGEFKKEFYVVEDACIPDYDVVFHPDDELGLKEYNGVLLMMGLPKQKQSQAEKDERKQTRKDKIKDKEKERERREKKDKGRKSSSKRH